MYLLASHQTQTGIVRRYDNAGRRENKTSAMHSIQFVIVLTATLDHSFSRPQMSLILHFFRYTTESIQLLRIYRSQTFPEGAGNFSLHHRVQNGSGAHPAWVPGALSLGVKWPER